MSLAWGILTEVTMVSNLEVREIKICNSGVKSG